MKNKNSFFLTLIISFSFYSLIAAKSEIIPLKHLTLGNELKLIYSNASVYQSNPELILPYSNHDDTIQKQKMISIENPNPNTFYFTDKNGWQMDRHVRTLADINGDGKDDIVGFGEKGVLVSFSDGSNFSVPKLLISNFAIGAGAWQVNEHVRTTGDVNGDGKDDIIGFGGGAVLVSLSTGNGFQNPVSWLDHSFTKPNGWNNRDCVRTVADVNGDGKADIVGFGGAGVYVALSNGSRFLKPELLLKNFAIGAGGWEVGKHTRLIADINNDDKADILGFGGEVFTALSIGNKFGPVEAKGNQFFTNPNWWNLKRHRRMTGDVNGDGKADIIGFTESKIYTALSNGNSFETQKLCNENFTYAQGWDPTKFPVLIGDINGDGKDDIIGFKADKVYTTYSNGDCFETVRTVVFY